jgi:ATP synthase protein I
MTSNRQPDPGTRRNARPEDDTRIPRPREADGWAIMSYMIAGMVLYGGIGWLVGHWTGISVLFPVGMIVGIAFSIILIIYRVTRS